MFVLRDVAVIGLPMQVGQTAGEKVAHLFRFRHHRGQQLSDHAQGLIRRLVKIETQQAAIGIALPLCQKIRDAPTPVVRGQGNLTLGRVGVGVFATHIEQQLPHVLRGLGVVQHALRNQLHHIGFAQTCFAQHGGAFGHHVFHVDAGVNRVLAPIALLVVAQSAKVHQTLRWQRAIHQALQHLGRRGVDPKRTGDFVQTDLTGEAPWRIRVGRLVEAAQDGATQHMGVTVGQRWSDHLPVLHPHHHQLVQQHVDRLAGVRGLLAGLGGQQHQKLVL